MERWKVAWNFFLKSSKELMGVKIPFPFILIEGLKLENRIKAVSNMTQCALFVLTGGYFFQFANWIQ